MIGGFIVQGPGPKRVIIRAIGPELTQHGITIPLADPRLELHNGTGALIASNNDWQTTILGGIITTNQVSDIQNSGHAPTAASESVIIADLQPGNYTAIVRGVNNTTGVALVEVYDLSPAASSSLRNISTRSFVETGSERDEWRFCCSRDWSKENNHSCDWSRAYPTRNHQCFG